MAKLTASGIEFSATNILNSKYGIIPQTNSPMLFIQSTAPTGWTRVSQNNKALRVVSASTNGGSTGGTNTFTAAFASRTINANVPVSINGFSMGNTTITINTMPPHSHPINAGGNGARSSPSPSAGTQTGANPGPATGNNPSPAGGGAAHNHPAGYTSASGPASCPLDMRIQYVDCNICSFN